MFVSDFVSLMQLVVHLISLSPSSTFPYVRTRSFVDERSWVARSTKTHQRGLFTSSPPPHPPLCSVTQPPSSLLRRWAGTPAEARLLFKAALSFHLFPLSASFFFFFFPADVNRVASQSFMPLWNTPHLENHKKQQKSERKEREQNKMGTAMAMLPPPPPPPRFLASRKTPFQSFPDF